MRNLNMNGSMTDFDRYILLDGLYNIRDLGGYQRRGGGVTAAGRILRADSMHSLTDYDKEKLLGMGLRSIIDLRSQKEIEQAPNVFADSDKVQYFHIPLLKGIQSIQLPIDTSPELLSDLYIRIIDNCQKELKKVFSTIADHDEGMLIFHCAAGKDRTGVIAALLLDAVDVLEENIIRDYSLSEKYMKPVFQRQKELLREKGVDISTIPNFIFESPRSNMIITLQYLRNKYDNAINYFKEINLTDKQIKSITSMLVSQMPEENDRVYEASFYLCL
jgi:protein-tyrosine phosphatase